MDKREQIAAAVFPFFLEDEAAWFASRNGGRTGPVDLSTVRKAASQAVRAADALVDELQRRLER